MHTPFTHFGKLGKTTPIGFGLGFVGIKIIHSINSTVEIYDVTLSWRNQIMYSLQSIVVITDQAINLLDYEAIIKSINTTVAIYSEGVRITLRGSVANVCKFIFSIDGREKKFSIIGRLKKFILPYRAKKFDS